MFNETGFYMRTCYCVMIEKQQLERIVGGFLFIATKLLYFVY